MSRAALLLAFAGAFLAPAALSAAGTFESDNVSWSEAGLWHQVAAPACVTPSVGAACAYYGLDSACDYDTGQAQDASLTTVSPVALSASDAVLDFWLLYQVQSYDPACQDRLRLEYSPDGQNWYVADDDFTVQGDPQGGSPAVGWASGSGLGGPPLWQHLSVSLAAFAGTAYWWRFRYLSSEEMAGNSLCSPPDLLQGFLGFALADVSLGQPLPPLELSKSVSPSLAAPGQTVTFSLGVTNTGASAAAVQVWDSLPAGVGYASAVGGSIAGGLAQWSLPSLGAGQSATLRLLAQVPPGAAVPQDWVDQAEASSSLTTTPLLSPQVLAKVRAGAVTLAKTVDPTSLASGAQATYCLSVENDTDVTQSALTLSDPLPAAFSPSEIYPPESGASSWTLASLAPGQVETFTLVGTVYGQGSSVVNTATLSQGSDTLASASASLSVSQPVRPTVSIQAIFPNPAPSHAAGAPQAAFVDYTLSAAMPMTLDIYDVAGRRVRSLSAPGGQGAQRVAWDLDNSGGRPVASGLYLLRLWSSLGVQPQPQATGLLAVAR